MAGPRERRKKGEEKGKKKKKGEKKERKRKGWENEGRREEEEAKGEEKGERMERRKDGEEKGEDRRKKRRKEERSISSQGAAGAERIPTLIAPAALPHLNAGCFLWQYCCYLDNLLCRQTCSRL